MTAPPFTRRWRLAGRPIAGALAIHGAACAGSTPTPDPTRTGRPSGTASDAGIVVAAAATDASAPRIPDAGAPAPAARFPGGTFPPADFAPPHERSAREGDGRWTTLIDGDPPLAVRATLQPHPISRYMPVTVAALDLERMELHLAPGLEDPESKALPRDQRSGLVPEGEQPRLRVAFNGGFKTRHGGHGMAWQGTVLVPPLDDACTVGIDAEGRVTIATWPNLSARAETLVSWRQTPPCLIEGGRKHPDLNDTTRRWGMSVEGKVKVRRSAVGLDERGRTLFYAVGEDVTARWLAEALTAVGAVSAAQLDINWSYTWFVTYAVGEGQAPTLAGSLIPKMKHHPRGLLTKAAHRDFFYVLARE